MNINHHFESFLLAGKARFTVTSNKTGARFTYNVQAAKDRETGAVQHDGPWFVKVFTGTCNDADYNDYSFIGTIFPVSDRFGPMRFRTSAKSKLPSSDIRCSTFAWLFENRDVIASKAITVQHEGMCGRCGRTLTVPESIESGFGPTCIALVSAA